MKFIKLIAIILLFVSTFSNANSQCNRTFNFNGTEYNLNYNDMLSYCGDGQPITLYINNPNSICIWSYGNVTDTSTFEISTIWISDTTNFYVNVIDTLNGTCSFNDSLLFVQVPPLLLNNSVSVSNPVSVCEGSPINLTLNYTNIDGITWNSNCGGGNLTILAGFCGMAPNPNPSPNAIVGTINTTNCGSTLLLTIGTSVLGCSDTTSYLINIISDCVYPGDTDYDLIVNNLDLLNIGLAYGDTGFARQNATTSWQGQSCLDWQNTFSNNINYKQADCNGDGIINDADTLAIYLNYGQTHAKAFNTLSSDYKMRLQCDKLNYNPSDSISLMVDISMNDNMITDFYGTAFSINYPEIIEESSLKAIMDTDWVGNDYLKIIKIDTLNNIISFALTLTNHQNISGFGDILKITGKLKDQSTFSTNPYVFTLFEGYYNDNTGELNTLESTNDSISINSPTYIKSIGNIDVFDIFPNPSNGTFSVSFNSDAWKSITVTNLLGEIIHETLITTYNTEIDISNQSKGIYFVTILGKGIYKTKKIIIE